MRKKLLIISLVVVLLLSFFTLFACGDDNGDNNYTSNDTSVNNNVNAVDAILPYSVNYDNISFEEMSDEDALDFLSSAKNTESNSSVYTTMPNTQIRFNGDFGIVGEDTSTDIKYENANILAAWKNLNDGSVSDIVFSANSDNNFFRVETYDDELRTQSSTNNKYSAYRLSMSQLMSDYYLKMYGLTPEQVAQKKADHEQTSQNISFDDIENYLHYIYDTTGNLILDMLSNGMFSLSKAIIGEKVHLKISVNCEKFVSFIEDMLKQLEPNYAKVFLPTINKLDIYATSNKGYFVDLKVDIDMSAYVAGVGLLYEQILPIMFKPILQPDWLDYAEPIIDGFNSQNVSINVLETLIAPFVPQDTTFLQNKSFAIKGDFIFRFSKTPQTGYINKDTCSPIDLDGILELLYPVDPEI